MELRQLRYFLAIAEFGSFSKAAEKVFVAQSALSHQLAQLEEELGASLFIRQARGVTLTAAGQRFQAHAQAILRQVEDARLSVANEEASPCGKVSFGIPHSLSNALALPLLKAIRQELPRVEFELTEELTGHLAAQLRTGQINLALLFTGDESEEFSGPALADEALWLISPGDAEQCPSTALPLAEALQFPLILPAAPHGVRPIIERAAQQAGLAAPRVIADISSVSILRTSLLAGLGHTLLPPMPLLADLEAGQLQGRPLREPALIRQIRLCSSRHVPLSAASLAVRRLTQAVVTDLIQNGRWTGAKLPEEPA